MVTTEHPGPSAPAVRCGGAIQSGRSRTQSPEMNVPSQSHSHPCCPRCGLPHERNSDSRGWHDLCDACERDADGEMDDIARAIEDGGD